MSSSWGCMLLMDWKSDSTALSLVMLRPRMWLLFMRFRKVVTAFCRALRNCSWFSSDSPFWYGCWRGAKVETWTKSWCLNRSRSAEFGVFTNLHYADRLNRKVTFNRLADWWKGLCQRHGGRGRGGGALPSIFLLLFPVGSIQVAGQLELWDVSM